MLLRLLALLAVVLAASPALGEAPPLLLQSASPPQLSDAVRAAALARSEAFWNPPAKAVTPFVFSEATAVEGAGPVRRATCVLG